MNHSDDDNLPILWHPEVHKHFSEELYYVLIKLTRPGPDRLDTGLNVYEQFRKELRVELFIKGFSIYSLFGSYDVMLRVWCNEDDFYKLHVFFEKTDLVRGFHSYISCVLNYTWTSSRALSPMELARIDTSYVNKVQADNYKEKKAALKNGLLVPRPKRDGQSFIKFFTHIPLIVKHSRNDLEAYLNFIDEIKEGISSASQSWPNILEITLVMLEKIVSPMQQYDDSAVNNSQLTDVIVKGIVPGEKIFEILSFSFDFSRCSFNLRGASETYLSAESESDWQESDSITATMAVGLKRLKNLIDIFSLNPKEILSLSPERCDWVTNQLTENSKIVNIEKDSINVSVFLAWLRAYLLDDNEQAFRTLSILMKMESYLSKMTIKILSQIKNPWYPKLIKSIFADKIANKNAMGNIIILDDDKAELGRIEKYTLADWITILKQIDNGNPNRDTKGMISDMLGQNCFGILYNLIPDTQRQGNVKGWRNSFAHGYLVDPLPIGSDITDEFAKLTDFIAKLAWLVYELKEYIAK